MPSTIMLASAGLLGVGLLFLGGVLVGRYVTSREADDDLLPEGDDEEPPALPAPVARKPRFGVLGELWTAWRYIKKRKRLQGKGKVQWFLVDGTWPTPKFIEPEYKGGGVPEYEHDGVRYLFPEDARLQSERQGLWTVVHSKGDAVPVNVKEPGELAIPPDMLDEYLTSSITSSAPGFLDRLDFDTDDLIMYAIALVIVLAAISRFL